MSYSLLGRHPESQSGPSFAPGPDDQNARVNQQIAGERARINRVDREMLTAGRSPFAELYEQQHADISSQPNHHVAYPPIVPQRPAPYFIQPIAYPTRSGPSELESAGTDIALGAVGVGGALSTVPIAISTAMGAFGVPGALSIAGTLAGYTIALPAATAIVGKYLGKQIGHGKLGATVGAATGLIAGSTILAGSTTAALTGLAIPAAIGATFGGLYYAGRRLFRN